MCASHVNAWIVDIFRGQVIAEPEETCLLRLMKHTGFKNAAAHRERLSTWPDTLRARCLKMRLPCFVRIPCHGEA